MIVYDGLPKGIEESQVTAWLMNCAERYDRRIEKLSISFLNERDIQKLNRSYLGHNYPTDIISFDYSEGVRLTGELYLGLPVILENAEYYRVKPGEELCRVMAHGLLHLIGFDDKEVHQKEEMRLNEDKCLLLRPKNLINKEL